MKELKEILISGKKVLPIVEGGKGIAASDGRSSGAFAAANAVGTFSAVLADMLDNKGNIIPKIIKGPSRRERFEQMVEQTIRGCIDQAKMAHEIAGERGRVFMNVLWEQGGSAAIIEGALEGARGLIHGIVCGAGMPFKLAEITSKYKTFYYPIISSARAFKALWMRSYRQFAEFLGGVVYEDPWKAGGHIGLSNSDDPAVPQAPYPRVVELRRAMNEVGLSHVPIIFAGGVWFLKEFEDWIDNPEIGPVAFQFGTRPLLTRESPVLRTWKDRLLSLKPGDVVIQNFSPTGFYSSAIQNKFLEELKERLATEIAFSETKEGAFTHPVELSKNKTIYIAASDKKKAERQVKQGLSVILRTPDHSIVFVTPETSEEIKKARSLCLGCLSQCRFSSWSQSGKGNNTGKWPDPRSFCIHEKLFKARLLR